MQPLYAMASISEFTSNPIAVLRKANNGAVIIVKNTVPIFYVVPPQVFEALMSKLASQGGLYQDTHNGHAEITEAALLEAPGDPIQPKSCPWCGGSGWVLGSQRTVQNVP